MGTRSYPPEDSTLIGFNRLGKPRMRMNGYVFLIVSNTVEIDEHARRLTKLASLTDGSPKIPPAACIPLFAVKYIYIYVWTD